MSDPPSPASPTTKDTNLSALEAIYGVGRVSSIYQSQPTPMRTPVTTQPDMQDLHRIYGQPQYNVPIQSAVSHTYQPMNIPPYPSVPHPPSTDVHSHSYSTYPQYLEPSYPSPATPYPSPALPYPDRLAPLQASHSSSANTSIESSPAVSSEHIDETPTQPHHPHPSPSQSTPTEKSVKGIRKMMSINTMSEERQKELHDIEAELKRLYTSVGVASYQELKEKIALANDKRDTLEKERDNRIKMRTESRSVLTDLNSQNKEDIATMKVCRARALNLTEEIKKGNEQLKEYKRHIGRYRSDAVRHATNADRECEELQRREPHHQRLKSTFEESVHKYESISTKTEHVKTEIRALEEFRQNEVKMIELKNLEAEMDRLSLIQESQQFDQVMQKSFMELNQLLQVCITEQHALDELYKSLDDPEIQNYADGEEENAM